MDKQDRFARVILNGFYAYFAEFENITLAARTRFEQAEWSGMQDISSRRIDIYKETVMETLAVARHIAGDQIEELTFWADTRVLYAELVKGMTNFEIAETFYNSILTPILAIAPSATSMRLCSRRRAMCRRLIWDEW